MIRRNCLVKCGKDVIIFEIENLNILFNDTERALIRTKITVNPQGIYFVYVKPYEFDDVAGRTLTKEHSPDIIIHGKDETVEEFNVISKTTEIQKVRLAAMINTLATIQGYDVGDFNEENETIRDDTTYQYILKLLSEEENTYKAWVKLLDRQQIYTNFDISKLLKLFDLALEEKGIDVSTIPDELPKTGYIWRDYLLMYIKSKYNYNELSDTFFFDLNDDLIKRMMLKHEKSFVLQVMDALSMYHLKPELEFISNVTCKIKDIKPHMMKQIICFDCDVSAVDDKMTITTKADYFCDRCNAMKIVTCDESRSMGSPKCKLCNKPMSEYRILESEHVQIMWNSDFIRDARNGRPDTIKTKLYGDFVGESFVGQKKRIVGTFKQEKKDRSKYNEIFIDIMCIISLDDEEISYPTEKELVEWQKLVKEDNFMDKLIDMSFTIKGHSDPKKCALLSITGSPETTKRMNKIHFYMIGDPGTAKTTLLEESLDLAHKGLMVTGSGTSKAGLTGGMDRLTNSSPLVFIPGSMTIVNNGVLGIDEFTTMNKDDRKTLLTSMSKGYAPINKIGIIGRLPTKTTIITTSNPKSGRWKDGETILDQIDISEPLLSRFALIFLIRDVIDEYKDTGIAEHIIDDMATSTEKTIDSEKVKRFINYVVRNFKPELNNDAKKHLKDYYVKLRKMSNKQNTLPIDPRKVEDITKLTLANARIHMRGVAGIEDAKEACRLFEESLKSFGIDTEKGTTMEVFKTSKQVNKEDHVNSCLSRLSTDGTFTEDEFIGEVGNGQFYTQDQAKNILNKLEYQGRISLNPDGTYRV